MEHRTAMSPVLQSSFASAPLAAVITRERPMLSPACTMDAVAGVAQFVEELRRLYSPPNDSIQ
jgi:hypothetical protein